MTDLGRSGGRIRRVRVGKFKLTIWTRSFPWLVEYGRRQWWIFDRGQNHA